MVHALNDLASQVTTGNMKTELTQEWFLNYCVANPNASIVFYVSDMVVKADSKATYLVISRAQSHTAGFIYMGNHKENGQIINAPIMVTPAS